MSETEPVQVELPARDVTPYRYGIWCRVEGASEPFVNAIELRRWSEDGTQIVFGLGTFNYDFRDPDELMRVVELPPTLYRTAALDEQQRAEDAAFMSNRPVRTRPCEHCGGTGKLRG